MSIEVILVAEANGYPDYLGEVKKLIDKKLKECDRVILALEQNFNAGQDNTKSSIIFDSEKVTQNGESAADIALKSNIKLKYYKEKIRSQSMKFDKSDNSDMEGAYSYLLLSCIDKPVTCIGIDTMNSHLPEQDIGRDSAMYYAIKTAIIENKEDKLAVIAIVDSKHIYNSGVDGEKIEDEDGQRLGSLLSLSPEFSVKVANYYVEYTKPYHLVKRDIDHFVVFEKLQGRDVEQIANGIVAVKNG